MTRNCAFSLLVLLLVACSGEGVPVMTTSDTLDSLADAGVPNDAFLHDVGDITDGMDSAFDAVGEDGLSDDAELSEVTQDMESPDGEVTCEPGSECFGEPCTSDSDCLSGACVLHIGAMVCSDVCVDDCPGGWSCETLTQGEPGGVAVCLSLHPSLCLPCKSDEDCSSQSDFEPNCLQYGPQGSFCGSHCGEETGCPAGYSCEERDGGSYCVLQDDECPCTAFASDQFLVSECSVENEWGICSGERVCSVAGLAECDAPEPTEETCDGADNDCDGETDEELGTTSCGQGVCEHTVENCLDGAVQNCDPMEGADIEVCDGADNDCDGETDEELGTTTCGQGVCEHTVESCLDGVEQVCDALEGAGIEVCDGADNDCDGETDEELGTTTCGQGVCEHTVENCVDVVPQICDPMEGAGAETCNGLDDDCNGEADDGLGETSCGQGLCAHSAPNCLNGGLQQCDPFEGSSAEACDGLDNDCDGETDEELGTTTCGQGVCEHTVENCMNGVLQQCDPFLGANPEVCDGADNNCNGEIDENLGSTTCGKGICLHTTENCVDGVSQVCDPFLGATSESCNGQDDNCDGSVDEGDPGGGLECVVPGKQGECAKGVYHCVNGGLQCMQTVFSKLEACNGLDDNCNGETDEGLGTTLCGEGICQHVMENCVGGIPQVCDPLEGAVPESCNSLDDDCNGQVDDGLGETLCGMGLCLHTVPNCLNGTPQECVPMEGYEEEVCNDIDDDCDGIVDGEAVCGPAAVKAITLCDLGLLTWCQTAYENNWNRTCKQILDTYNDAGWTLPEAPHEYRVTYAYADPAASPAMWTQIPWEDVSEDTTTCGNMENDTSFPVTATWDYPWSNSVGAHTFTPPALTTYRFAVWGGRGGVNPGDGGLGGLTAGRIEVVDLEDSYTIIFGGRGGEKDSNGKKGSGGGGGAGGYNSGMNNPWNCGHKGEDFGGDGGDSYNHSAHGGQGGGYGSGAGGYGGCSSAHQGSGGGGGYGGGGAGRWNTKNHGGGGAAGILLDSEFIIMAGGGGGDGEFYSGGDGGGGNSPGEDGSSWYTIGNHGDGGGSGSGGSGGPGAGSGGTGGGGGGHYKGGGGGGGYGGGGGGGGGDGAGGGGGGGYLDPALFTDVGSENGIKAGPPKAQIIMY